MKAELLLPAAILICLGFAPAVAPSMVQREDKIVGDYVEARTASVFAGACHYNGELVTTGSQAVAAWNVTSGSWKGTDLSGMRAMAAVNSDTNLGQNAARQSDLVVNAGASPAQIAAFSDYLRTTCGDQIGKIVSVHQTAITFEHADRKYTVNAEQFGKLVVEGMPNDDCCKQPSLVWYSPLMKVSHPKVGFTTEAAYSAGKVGDAWDRSGENSAFYGPFGG